MRQLRPVLGWHIILWLATLGVPSVLCSSRIMGMTNDMYCAVSTLQPPVGITQTLMKCTMKCKKTAGCVAISYRAANQCLLHDAWCSPGDLLNEPAAVYAEVNWECEKRSCYYVRTLKTLKTKADADAVCAAMGAHVAAPETEEENQIINAIAYQPVYYPVPGTNQLMSPAHWMDLINDVTWAHSGQPATYFNWGPNEPKPHEFCTEIEPTKTWHDIGCHFTFGFMCEVEW